MPSKKSSRTPKGSSAKPARSRTRASTSRQAPKPAAKQPPQKTLDERILDAAAPRRREIAGLLIALLGVFSLVCLVGVGLGRVGDWWRGVLTQTLGWGSWVLSLSLILLGAHMALPARARPWQVKPPQIVGFEVTFVASLALSHLSSAAQGAVALTLAAAGRGGGYVGWALSVPLVEGLGLLVAWLILSAVWLVGVAFMLQVTWRDIQSRFEVLSAGLQAWADQLSQRADQIAPTLPDKSTSKPRTKPRRTKPERKPAASSPQPHELIIARPAISRARSGARPPHLPTPELLDVGSVVEMDEAEVRDKAAIIEKTLLDFGLPVQVIEVRRGPAVTQFGLAPQYIEKAAANGEVREQKVRVSQITALANDLTLALSATRIRMEAPVPGRPIVGVEVPNTSTSLVHLRPVLESVQHHKLGSNLAIPLGVDVSGTPVAADLATMPHLLIAGTTGSGKSVCINSITAGLVFNNTPEELGLVMIDPKMVELVRFNGLPHLMGKVEVDLERIIGVLRWLAVEMDGRYKLLSEVGVRHLADYNKLANRRKSLDRLPNIVLLIDELADLMMMAPEEVETTLVRLAQMARAVGIHLVVATQRPSTDIVTGLIKANFPARIAFAVASSIDSRVIIDTGRRG